MTRSSSLQWSPLHNIVIVWHRRKCWIIRNLTSGLRSPGTFKSADAAWAWLIRMTDPLNNDAFMLYVERLSVISKRGEVSTALYGGVRYKNRLRATQKGAAELKTLKSMGMVVGNHRKGGFKVWNLTKLGERIIELHDRAQRSNECQNTSSSSKTGQTAA